MSKAHMVVLGLLKVNPAHGYQMGQMVEQLNLPSWTGITLPAIYKAIQTLEKAKYIVGEEMREGNNPPRTVYSLNEKGVIYLRQIVYDYLFGESHIDREWWLALHFTEGILTKDEMLKAIEKRMLNLKEVARKKRNLIKGLSSDTANKLPFVHGHLLSMAHRYVRCELQSLEELKQDIESGGQENYFLQKGSNR